MNVSLSKLREMVKDREGWHAAVHGVTKNQTQVSDWTTICTCVHMALKKKKPKMNSKQSPCKEKAGFVKNQVIK